MPRAWLSPAGAPAAAFLELLEPRDPTLEVQGLVELYEARGAFQVHGPASSTPSPPLLHPSCTDPDPEEKVMRAKLLVAAAAGLALLALPALAQTRASPGGPPPLPPAGHGDDDDHDEDHDGMMGPRHPMMGPRHGLTRHHRFGPPPGTEAGQLRLAPAVHVRRGDLVLDLECSVRDSVEDCASAALRLLERLESPPP